MSQLVALHALPTGTRHVFVTALQLRDLQLKSSAQGCPTSVSAMHPFPG
jgi:hypothetical protein